MNFKLSNEAEVNLEKIWSYTLETWSIEQADRSINLIFDEIDYIYKNPKSGIDFSFLREGYYRSKMKSHFIFYKINKIDNKIKIIRIFNKRMDIENRLKQYSCQQSL